MASITSFAIPDDELRVLAKQVVIITGASSGIGLATATLLLELGASVLTGDVNQCPLDHPKHTHVRTDVTDWASLKELFSAAVRIHGRVDHVFANAGIGGRHTHRASDEQYDANGELQEPSTLVYDVNLRGVVNTTHLALHHFRTQEPAGGSIVVTASASAFQPFRMTDYATAKHGVLGFMRAIAANLKSDGEHPSIRANAITPGWTNTGLLPLHVLDAIGAPRQPPSVVAKSVVHLMADKACHANVVYSENGIYWEIEQQVLMPAVQRILQTDTHDDVYGRLRDYANSHANIQ